MSATNGLYRPISDKIRMPLICRILNITSESCISTICVFYILRADKFLKKDIFGSLFFYIYSFSE
jgi:hypothetical protein